MKKLLFLTLASLMLLASLTSCRIPEKKDPFKEILEENPDMELPKSEVMEVDPEDIPKQELPEIEPNITDEDYDEIISGDNSGDQDETKTPGEPPVDNPPTTEAPEGSQVPTGFVAKQKKYNYGENNIVMLNVTNQNTDNYSVKVEGYYLDADGAVLKTETKFVEGYAAGYVKDFLFNPGIAFDSFKFTLTAEKFDGVCFEQNYVIKGLHLKEDYGYVSPFDPPGFEPPPAQYPAILMGYETFGYHGPVYPIRFYTYYIIVDAHGNIYNIHEERQGFRAQVPTAVNATFYQLRLTHTKEELWPEELRDGYQILYAFYSQEWKEENTD